MHGTQRDPDAPMGKTTLGDVANLAGVSLSTASKALRGRTDVSDATRRKVAEAAAKLSYQAAPPLPAFPSPSANQRSGLIGIITSDLEGRFSTPVLIGAEDELGTSDTSVILCNAKGNRLLEQHYVQTLLNKNIDGIIVMNARTEPRQPLPDDVPVPVVYAYGPSTTPEDCSITIDNVGAGRLAVQHLLSCGRSKIALVGGLESFKAARDRIDGALAELRDNGLNPAGDVRFGPWNETWGRGATGILIKEKVDFDAIICGNDHIARGCLESLKQNGIDVPWNVAVIGHDNWDPLVASSRPSLTSIDNSMEALGALAARRLMEAIEGHQHHGLELVPCQLVQRESTLPLIG